MKIFWLFNHPAPYKIDFFNELGKEVELTAMFIRDEEYVRNATFYSASPRNFIALYVHAKKIGDVNSNSRVPLKHLKSHKYDIVVINGYRSFTEMRVISYLKRKKIPYIFYINGGIIKKENFLVKALKKHFIKGANAYLCPDENSMAYLVHYGANPKSVSLYPYSSVKEEEVLKKPLTKEQKRDIRKEYGLPEGKLFVSTGFFIERKNFVSLISIFAKYQEPSTLLLIGEGEQEKAMRDKIAELKLNNVIIMPFKEHKELLRILSSCDAFLFLSKEDIYGHVIEEALSQGLPVMSSNGVNAAKHLIRDGVNGFVVDVHDDEDILKAMSNLTRRGMAEQSLAIAKDNTILSTLNHHLTYFAEYYERLKSK